MRLSIDVTQTAAFIAALTGTTNGYRPVMSWLTLPETSRGRRYRPNVLHGYLEDCAEQLGVWNEEGHGIFLMVNGGDLQGIAAENVRAVRAHFIDADGPLAKAIAVPPTLGIATARGEHWYWRVHDGSVATFADVQRQLAAYYATDGSVCDLPRKMRAPGFYHLKSGTPVMVRLCGVAPERVYSVRDLCEAHPVAAAACPQPYVPTHTLDGNLRAFEAWARCKEIVMGRCHQQALKIASAGVQRGLDPADVEQVVLAYCVRAEASRPADYPKHAMTPRQECRAIMRSVLRRHRA